MTSATDENALPVDPDVEGVLQRSVHGRAIHLRLPYLALAFAGGTLGTAAREALSLVFPPLHGVSIATFCINVSGAFMLGIVLDSLFRRGPDHGHRRILRILLGTGFMGGFTTYSTLATGSAELMGGGSPMVGAAYGLATVIVGACATWAGILVAAAFHRLDCRGE